MKNLWTRIKDNVEFLSFKISAMRLFCRMVNATRKDPEWDNILAKAKIEYEKVENKSGMYPGLVKFLYEQLLIDVEEE